MKLLVTTLLVLATTMVHVPLVSGQTNTSATPCDQEMDDFCATEANRYCYISNETNQPMCGNCFPGYVEWRARCLSEDQVDIALFLETYMPKYKSNLTQVQRAELLIKAIQFIAQYQNQNPPPPFQLGLNAFSADSEEDLRAHLGFNASMAAAESASSVIAQSSSSGRRRRLQKSSTTTAPLPETVDWVEQGVVTSVKDQGRCGCCWAVSTAGAIEGAVAIQNEFLQSISFQQYISCDKDNSGCNGGSLVNALTYTIQDTKGIAELSAYPFTDSGGTTTEQCDTTVPPAVGLTKASYVINFNDNFSFEERVQKMKEAVAKQPVSMAIKSSCQIFNNYRSGILTTDSGCECNESTCADHAVLMVGYDDTSNPPSWKLKNSWGTGWGEEGYFRIAQTQQGEFGLFGVLSYAVVPDLTFNMTAGTISESSTSTQSDESELPWWAWLLILLAAIAIIFATVSCLSGCLCPRKKN